MTERMDDLFAEALASGVIPDGVTAEERLELEDLLAATQALSSQAAPIRLEAEASLPVARARFERFLEREQAVPAPVTKSSGSGGFFSWFRGSGGQMRAFAAAAAIVVLVAVGAFAIPALFNDVETASAEVLVPGEYVQFEAVAGDTTNDSFGANADFGNVQVVVDQDTVLVDSAGNTASNVEPGRLVVVGGVVGDDHRVQARTISVSDGDVERPDERRPEPLDRFREIDGRIVALTLGEDGQPRVAILTNNELVVVKVEARSLQALLQNVDTAIGTDVTVVHIEGTGQPVFGVERAPGDQDGPPPGHDRPRPELPSVSGVLTSVDGALLTIATPAGSREVRLTLRTQFRVVDPTFDFSNMGSGEAVGRFITVFLIRPEGATGVPAADTVVIGGDAP